MDIEVGHSHIFLFCPLQTHKMCGSFSFSFFFLHEKNVCVVSMQSSIRANHLLLQRLLPIATLVSYLLWSCLFRPDSSLGSFMSHFSTNANPQMSPSLLAWRGLGWNATEERALIVRINRARKQEMLRRGEMMEEMHENARLCYQNNTMSTAE